MPQPVLISIGGISIKLVSNHLSGEYDFVKKLGDFCQQVVEDEPITLQVHCGQFPELLEESFIFETNHSWQMLQVDDKIVIQIPSEKKHQLGIFPEDFQSGDIYVSKQPGTDDTYVFPLAYPMGELFMMNYLGRGQGLLLHAAGVIHHGEGYVFTGHGGIGKSTMAGFWFAYPDTQVVNDDKVIIRYENGVPQLYGTPWHGEGGMALPLSAPLKRIYLLEQADHNYVKQVSGAEFTARLMAGSFIPLWDKNKVSYMLEFVSQLYEQIPCMELGFLPNASIIDFVLSQS